MYVYKLASKYLVNCYVYLKRNVICAKAHFNFEEDKVQVEDT